MKFIFTRRFNWFDVIVFSAINHLFKDNLGWLVTSVLVAAAISVFFENKVSKDET